MWVATLILGVVGVDQLIKTLMWAESAPQQAAGAATAAALVIVPYVITRAFQEIVKK
jgi:hypothetical protein